MGLVKMKKLYGTAAEALDGVTSVTSSLDTV